MSRMSLAPRQSLAGVGNAANSRQSLAPRGARQSIAPKPDARASRGESLGGRRVSTAPGVSKDPRGITDKAFKREAIDKLISYLQDHGFDKPVTPQMLQAPAVSLFVHIMSFLLKATVPNFEFGGRFEDEVPTVLKLLGYPYAIQRTSLQSVGAPHAWPPILAAISWLVDLLRYSEAAASDSALDSAEGADGEGFDEDAGTRMFFDYCQEGYALFLRGEDDLTPLEERVAFQFEAKNSRLRSDIESLGTANNELSKEHRGLTEGLSPLATAQRNNADLVSDQAKFEKHISDLYEHRKKVTARLDQEKVEASERTSELAALLKEIDGHKKTIAAQELTPADVQRMYAEKEHLEAELSGLGKQKDQLAKQLWEEELTTSRAIDRLETKVQQANNCSLRLHLVPADAKHAHGADHEISLDKGRLAADPSSAVLLQPNCTLQHALHRIKGAVGAEVNAAQDHLLEAEEGTAKREEHAVERQEQLATLKASLAKLEKEEKDLRDEHAAILAEKAAETERLEDSIKRAKSVNGQEVAASSAERTALQKEYDEFKITAAASRERMYSQLVSSIDMLTLHKENVEAQLAGLRKHCTGKIDSLFTSLNETAVELA